MELKLMSRADVEKETTDHAKQFCVMSEGIAQMYADRVNDAWKNPLQFDEGVTVVLPLYSADPLTRKACEDALLILLLELAEKDFHTLWKPYSSSRKNLGELTVIL